MVGVQTIIGDPGYICEGNQSAIIGNKIRITSRIKSVKIKDAEGTTSFKNLDKPGDSLKFDPALLVLPKKVVNRQRHWPIGAIVQIV